ncbi:type III secretion system cytoplasmic ring protein SctQ [Luteimonas lutimaris]|uniref:Flagellar motor switch protein FliN-like C-terminal domain-containing protein n=1 Tax=Luteimonas lutimaris TaxID=698645 RepID=A0ABP7M2E1_9GAMM
MPDTTAARKPRTAAKPSARKPPAPAVRALRGHVPEVAPAQAEALRGFFAVPRHWALGDSTVLWFTPGTAPKPEETFWVDAEGRPLQLRLEADAAIPPGPSGLHWSDYRGRARLLAWSLAHERALMRLSEVLGTALVPREPADDDGEGDNALWLSFATDSEPEAAHEALRGAVRLPLDWLPRLQGRAEPVYEDDPLPPLGALRGLPVPLQVGFDGPALSAAEWQSLRPGDVVLLGNAGLPALHADAARLTWPLAAAPDGWRIAAAAQPQPSPTEPSMTNDETPNDAAEPEGADGAEAATGDQDAAARPLPVQLSFEIGRMEVSVGDMASLQPGYVFALPTQLQGSNVTIRANGRSAGRGEVVAVGDTLGVRLLAWD